MGTVTFHPFADVPTPQWTRLLNDPDVRRHMPLAGGTWDDAGAEAWARSKDAQWQQNGYGPWAIRIDGVFAGWGGFQQEGEAADLGLVLLPAWWGHGRKIFEALVLRGIQMGLANITILLPVGRARTSGLARLGFSPAGEVKHDGHEFRRLRLERAAIAATSPPEPVSPSP